jgi:hypothetical protein
MRYSPSFRSSGSACAFCGKKDWEGGPLWKSRDGVEAMAKALDMKAHRTEEQSAFVSRLFAALNARKIARKVAA